MTTTSSKENCSEPELSQFFFDRENISSGTRAWISGEKISTELDTTHIV